LNCVVEQATDVSEKVGLGQRWLLGREPVAARWDRCFVDGGLSVEDDLMRGLGAVRSHVAFLLVEDGHWQDLRRRRMT
jgi:hypothetical protein